MPEATESGQNDISTGKDNQAEETLLTGKPVAGESAGDAGKVESKGEAATDIPEAYEFTLPEGMELDKGMADKAQVVFKELGLSQEKASKLTEMYAAQKAADAQADKQRFQQMKESWISDIKADKEIGGQNFDKSLGVALKTIEAFGSPEFSQFLEESGMGSHPDMVRFCRNIGLRLIEDSPGTGEPAVPAISTEDKLYGDTTPKTRAN